MENLYNKIHTIIRRNKSIEKLTLLFCKYIPYITGISYGILLFYLLITQDSRLLISIVKPLIVFLIVTIFRKLINRPRPYDVLDIKPLFKHKKGESFPSRHTASAFIIALTVFSINQTYGIALIVIACLVGITRIIAGVHYISDVLVAIIIAYFGWVL